MKKLIISLIACTGFLFPLLAQVDHDQSENEIVPVESLTLKKEQIPAAVVKAVNTDFTSEQAFRYGKFPYVLEKHGWIVAKSQPNVKPDFYEVNIKAHDGSDIYAVYSPDGTIIESRTIRKNAALPPSVLKALENSRYKGWNVASDKEIIKYFNSRNNIEEHFRITVEKNNVKRTISFNYNEPAKGQA